MYVCSSRPYHIRLLTAHRLCEDVSMSYVNMTVSMARCVSARVWSVHPTRRPSDKMHPSILFSMWMNMCTNLHIQAVFILCRPSD